jgi:hypothetical protein
MFLRHFARFAPALPTLAASLAVATAACTDAGAGNTDESLEIGKGDGAATPAKVCKISGGTWVIDTCDCRPDDPEAGHFVFDAARGCVPAPAEAPDLATLCGETGGVWSNDVCDCNQDPGSAFMEFTAERGCNVIDDSELRDAALNGGAMALLAFEPAEGAPIHFVHRPGVADFVARHGSVAETLDALDHLGLLQDLEEAGACDGALAAGPLPEVECSAAFGIAEEGCHLVSLPGHAPRLVALMERTNALEMSFYDADDFAAAQAADASVRAVFTDARHGMMFAFARHNGTWALVWVDVSHYECGT